MALTSFQEIPVDFDEEYSRILYSGDRFISPRVRAKRLFFGRLRLRGLTQRSLIPILAPIWNSFTTPVKTAWNSAGVVSGLAGFKLFVQDTALRMANSLTGYSTPNNIYQARVGKLHIQAPATELILEQPHPLNYFVMRKIHGTRSQYQPVPITESFDLPISLKIAYKTNLTVSGANPRARFYVDVVSHYQGLTIHTPCEINFNLIQNWIVATSSLSSVIGKVRGYTAYIELHDLHGDFWFDNIEINHSAHNWARDAHCNNIRQSFTRGFYQVPSHWGAVSLPFGSFFDSVFFY